MREAVRTFLYISTLAGLIALTGAQSSHASIIPNESLAELDSEAELYDDRTFVRYVRADGKSYDTLFSDGFEWEVVKVEPDEDTTGKQVGWVVFIKLILIDASQSTTEFDPSSMHPTYLKVDGEWMRQSEYEEQLLELLRNQ